VELYATAVPNVFVHHSSFIIPHLPSGLNSRINIGKSLSLFDSLHGVVPLGR
jgi:hypothetical protein